MILKFYSNIKIEFDCDSTFGLILKSQDNYNLI